MTAVQAILVAVTMLDPGAGGGTGHAVGPIEARPLRPDQLAPAIKRPPGLERALAWSDKNGENLLLLSVRRWQAMDKTNGDKLPAAEIRIDHLLLAAAGPKTTLRTVRDGPGACELDLTAKLLGAAAVTDLDGDGLAEATFAYAMSCKGDVSPDIVKLLVIENGDKYILRGQSPDPAEEQPRAPPPRPDPAEARWPRAFLEHARATWRKLVERAAP